ncbi:MAG: outer membrane lipoprotein-sorting protein [Acidobacteria bacterium]|nr:outer membrane lipoprotein-sorting protein [Acidobacteriota bacterium]
MTHGWHKSVIAGAGLAAFLLTAGVCPARSKNNKEHLSLSQILSRMNESAKHLKTVSADLEYTKVTVLVNDKSTETGQIYFRNSRSPEILIDFNNPDSKVILFKKDKAEMYLPKINQIQEWNLSKHATLIQKFLLLGFGTDTKELEKTYTMKYLQEEQLGNDTTVLLELIPRKESVAAQLTKVHLWVSEESWLPLQQKFFEANGDYSIARYSSVKVNRYIPSSKFRINAAKNATRITM